jgi:hypothetical protein
MTFRRVHHINQTHVFGHGNEEEVHPPFVGSNIPRTKAYKLHGVQGKTNKKMDVDSSAIAYAIENSSKGHKKI